MPQTQAMSIYDKLAISMQAFELEKQGKYEEAQKIMHTIPLPSYLAKWAKKRFGVETLINTGWNLSEAEAEYGSDFTK